jgi:hypothetical protein
MSVGSRVPWLALGILAGIALLYGGGRVLQAVPMSLPDCPMKICFGIPCATCGLTRCLMALAQGHWGEAFHWHPVAVGLGLASPLAMGWDFRRAWRGVAYPSLPDSLVARLCVAGLLAGTWVLQIVRGI